MTEQKREVWQRGPVPAVPALLQPVAHALLQAREELEEMMTGFPQGQLWQKPAGMASAGFHLQHLSGVLDRVFTYARNEPLSEAQLAALAQEGKDTEAKLSPTVLVERFNRQVDIAIQQLIKTEPNTLPDYRGIGRAGLPGTVIGLLFHAAEHTMRHIGQLLVTVAVLRDAGGFRAEFPE